MLRKLLICITVTCISFVFCQTNETAKLLTQSENRVFTLPDETIKTVNFLLKSGREDVNEATLFLLLAKANYAKGNYDISLTNAFEAVKLAEKQKDETVLTESLIFISLIFDYMQLKNGIDQLKNKFPQNELSETFLKYHNALTLPQEKSVQNFREILKRTKNAARKEVQIVNNLSLNEVSRFYAERLQVDSAEFYAQDAVSQSKNDSLGNYFLSRSLVSLGNVYFLKKENSKAEEVYESALIFAENLDNPFLEMEIHHKLAANFMAGKNVGKFHFHNQQANNRQNLADQNENNAANAAYQLLSGEQDLKVSGLERTMRYWLVVLCVVLGILILLRIFLHFRNRNRLKTYQTLLDYLNRQEEANGEARETLAALQESRPTTILKESENHILSGLKRFEVSKKFTNKEMSLGMLAAQLNTNTKYLSEIINRHKQKNFNSYINELRINYITEKIKNDPTYLNYKVSYLAEEAGFSSHSTFTTVFKAIVGVSPIIFVEFVKNQKENPE